MEDIRAGSHQHCIGWWFMNASHGLGFGLRFGLGFGLGHNLRKSIEPLPCAMRWFSSDSSMAIHVSILRPSNELDCKQQRLSKIHTTIPAQDPKWKHSIECIFRFLRLNYHAKLGHSKTIYAASIVTVHHRFWMLIHSLHKHDHSKHCWISLFIIII